MLRSGTRTLQRLRRLLRDWRQTLSINLNFDKRNLLVEEHRRCRSVDDVFAFTQKHLDSEICQRLGEIKRALAVIASRSPRVVCEIGTARGGSTLLLSMLPTVDLMIGLDLNVRNKAYLKLLRRPSQRLVLLDGSSYCPGTVTRVRRILNGRTIDVLFVDGDHRYRGVASDFLSYRSFVSEGGLILFHDIVPDRGDGSLWAGDVPIFWPEVKRLYPHQEFIEDPQQIAYGIGLIHYSRSVELPLGFGKGEASVEGS